MNRQVELLFEAATRPYRDAGWYAWRFARGKLRHDPVFFTLLRRGLLPDQGCLFDLGCGQGVLLALLAAAKRQFVAGAWPAGWPPPPTRLAMHGMELRADRVAAAKAALNGAAHVQQTDISQASFGTASSIVLLDVLLYLDSATQRLVLQRISAALPPGGVLLLREADAGAGLAFQVTQWAERVSGMGRGLWWQKLHYRHAAEWEGMLRELEFDVATESMSQGTPFANVLFVARRRGC